MTRNGLRPIPPGEILSEEFLKPSGLTATALARAIGVPPNRITAIIKGQRGITGDTALRFSAFFGTTPELWLNLQKTYELRLAEKALGTRVLRSIEKQRRLLAAE
jgi:addiction module HigA family antidote